MKWILHSQTNYFGGSDELSYDGHFFLFRCLDGPILFYILSVLYYSWYNIFFLMKQHFCEAVL